MRLSSSKNLEIICLIFDISVSESFSTQSMIFECNFVDYVNGNDGLMGKSSLVK